jgi:hypothetical protein
VALLWPACCRDAAADFRAEHWDDGAKLSDIQRPSYRTVSKKALTAKTERVRHHIWLPVLCVIGGNLGWPGEQLSTSETL